MKAFIVALLIANTGIDDMYYRYNPAGGWAEAGRLAQDTWTRHMFGLGVMLQ